MDFRSSLARHSRRLGPGLSATGMVRGKEYRPFGTSALQGRVANPRGLALMADKPQKPGPAPNPSALEPPSADGRTRSVRASAQSQERLAAGLAMIAGFVDAYGIITYGVYVSFMSGNTTQTGYQAAEGQFGLAAASALAILFFVGGSFAGTLLVEFAGGRARRLLFGVVAALLTGIIGFWQLGVLSVGVHIATASFAMGVMNSALSRVGAQAVSLTFVTGTLSRVGSHLALAAKHAPLADAQGPWDTHLRRAMILARVWAGFLAGAILSGAATPRFGVWVLAAPALILAALAALDRGGGATRPSR
jgi:uncharacterized membrane protein YoaK (UPF0700 family)